MQREREMEDPPFKSFHAHHIHTNTCTSTQVHIHTGHTHVHGVHMHSCTHTQPSRVGVQRPFVAQSEETVCVGMCCAVGFTWWGPWGPLCQSPGLGNALSWQGPPCWEGLTSGAHSLSLPSG